MVGDETRSGHNRPVIHFADGDGPAVSATEIEFVDGPRAGERAAAGALPATIDGSGGIYRRSVACADDGAVRYVWSATTRAETMQWEPRTPPGPRLKLLAFAIVLIPVVLIVVGVLLVVWQLLGQSTAQ